MSGYRSVLFQSCVLGLKRLGVRSFGSAGVAATRSLPHQLWRKNAVAWGPPRSLGGTSLDPEPGPMGTQGKRAGKNIVKRTRSLRSALLPLLPEILKNTLHGWRHHAGMRSASAGLRVGLRISDLRPLPGNQRLAYLSAAVVCSVEGAIEQTCHAASNGFCQAHGTRQTALNLVRHIHSGLPRPTYPRLPIARQCWSLALGTPLPS
jgi:hypothetical protein